MGRAFVAAALIAAGLAGCGRAEDSGGSGEPTQAPSASTLRPPAYAPLYPGAVVESEVAASGPNAGATITFHTAGKPADVIAFYRRTAQSAGLESTFSSQSGEDQLFSAGRQGTDEGVQVIATPADSGASVQLFWTGARSR